MNKFPFDFKLSEKAFEKIEFSQDISKSKTIENEEWYLNWYIIYIQIFWYSPENMLLINGVYTFWILNYYSFRELSSLWEPTHHLASGKFLIDLLQAWMTFIFLLFVFSSDEQTRRKLMTKGCKNFVMNLTALSSVLCLWKYLKDENAYTCSLLRSRKFFQYFSDFYVLNNLIWSNF